MLRLLASQSPSPARIQVIRCTHSLFEHALLDTVGSKHANVHIKFTSTQLITDAWKRPSIQHTHSPEQTEHICIHRFIFPETQPVLLGSVLTDLYGHFILILMTVFVDFFFAILSTIKSFKGLIKVYQITSCFPLISFFSSFHMHVLKNQNKQFSAIR